MYSLDLHFAGTDTTSNTLLTGFLYLMNHPHVQGMNIFTIILSMSFVTIISSGFCLFCISERCQEEIDKVLEGKDYAAFDDRHNMPYVQVHLDILGHFTVTCLY